MVDSAIDMLDLACGQPSRSEMIMKGKERKRCKDYLPLRPSRPMTSATPPSRRLLPRPGPSAAIAAWERWCIAKVALARDLTRDLLAPQSMYRQALVSVARRDEMNLATRSLAWWVLRESGHSSRRLQRDTNSLPSSHADVFLVATGVRALGPPQTPQRQVQPVLRVGRGLPPLRLLAADATVPRRLPAPIPQESQRVQVQARRRRQVLPARSPLPTRARVHRLPKSDSLHKRFVERVGHNLRSARQSYSPGCMAGWPVH